MYDSQYQKEKQKVRKTTHKRVEVQFTIAEYKQFKAIADKEGISLNMLIHNMAIAYRDTSYFMPNELKTSVDKLGLLIRNIADNINQMAHTSNLFHLVDQKLVFKHLRELDSDIKDFINSKVK